MKLALLVAFTLAGCVPPQQPSYFTQPGANQPPPPVAATAAAPTASCQDTLNCYGTCNPMTDACLGTCDQRTTPESSQDARAVVQCMAASGCQDQNCVAQQCGAQITACTNVTLAVAPAQPQAPASGGGTGCEAVMQPEYNSVNSIYIPPLKCVLTQADLTGEWDSGMGTGQGYYDSSGNYAGYSAVSTADHYTIDEHGRFRDDWKGAYTQSGAAMARGMSQTSTGTFILGASNVIRIDREAHDDIKARTEFYKVVGWYAATDEITMHLEGPFYGSISQDDIDQDHTAMREYFHRKR
jgi:hypothetical protein